MVLPPYTEANIAKIRSVGPYLTRFNQSDAFRMLMIISAIFCAIGCYVAYIILNPAPVIIAPPAPIPFVVKNTAVFAGMGDDCTDPHMQQLVSAIADGTGVNAKCIAIGNGSETSMFMKLEA